MHRFIKFSLVLILFLLASGAVSAVQEGDIDAPREYVAGLMEPVEIYRDDRGVPSIHATSNHDLFFGLGYAMAEDRLWQMDGSRRLARGLVAEIAGRDQLHWDIYHRTLGLARTAEESLPLIDPTTLEYMQAFADGVNAYIDEHRDNLSFEFLLLHYEPTPWEVTDSLVIARLVAAWLSADSFDEEMYGDLINVMGEENAQKLFPPVPLQEPDYEISGGNPVAQYSYRDELNPAFNDSSAPDEGTSQQLAIAGRLFSGLLEPLARISKSGSLMASNIWAVDGSRTENGEPMLAMDPHLNYFSPAILYEVTLEGGDFDCWGVTFPGMPFLPFGANRHIAWGASNLPADCQDLFIEKLNPSDPLQYEADGEYVDFDILHERIPYKDSSGLMQTFLQDIYISRHGPIIEQNYGDYIALKWTGHDPSDDVTSILNAMLAENIEDFYEAFRDYHCPPQNFCVAETGPDGRVGQIIVGRIPIRSGYTGAHPVEGNNPDFQWTGFIRYDDHPHRIDPPEGFVAHANNLPLGVLENDRPLGYSLGPNYRVERIAEMIRDESAIDFDYMRLMQMDDLDITARYFVPALLDSWGRKADEYPDLEEYIPLLRDWDYHLGRESIPASIYQLWLIELVQTCIMDEIPSSLYAYIGYEDRWLPLLMEYIDGRSELDWLSDDTPDGRDRKLLDSLQAAIRRLQDEVSADSAEWAWGDLNEAVFPHPSGMEQFIGGGRHPWGGGRYTVRVGHYMIASSLPFTNDFGTVFRAVLSSENSRWRIGACLPPGQAGCVFWPHGEDQMSMWLEGELRTVHFGAVEDYPICGLLLEPLPGVF